MLYDYKRGMRFEVIFSNNPVFSAFVKTAITDEDNNTIALLLLANGHIFRKKDGAKYYFGEEKVLDENEIETIKGYETVTLKEYDKEFIVIKEKEYKVKDIIFN